MNRIRNRCGMQQGFALRRCRAMNAGGTQPVAPAMPIIWPCWLRNGALRVDQMAAVIGGHQSSHLTSSNSDTRAFCQTFFPIAAITKTWRRHLIRVPEVRMGCHVRHQQPVRLAVGIHGPPACTLWRGFPIDHHHLDGINQSIDLNPERWSRMALRRWLCQQCRFSMASQNESWQYTTIAKHPSSEFSSRR